MAIVILDGRKVGIRRMPNDVKTLLALLGVSPQEAIVKVDGEVRDESATLNGVSSVEVIRVVFGG